MRLRLEGGIRTGDDLLDRRVTDFAVRFEESGVIVYATTGRFGGLSAWSIESAGGVRPIGSVIFPDTIAGLVSDRLSLEVAESGAMLYVGEQPGGMLGYRLGPTGSFEQSTIIGWSTLDAAARAGSGNALDAAVTMTSDARGFLPPWAPTGEVVGLHTVRLGDSEFVVTACASCEAVAVFRRDTSTGQLIATDQLGTRDGLGIAAPTAVEVVSIGETHFVVVAASGTSSLAVLRLGPDGQLTPVDFLIDTASTQFGKVQALAVAAIEDRAFVVAGGADGGLSLFLLLPDGQLLFLDTVVDATTLPLEKISALSAVIVGDTLHIFTGSESEGGIAHFTVPLASLGETLRGRASGASSLVGGVGDDLLFAAHTSDTLSGGAGLDVLVSGPGHTIMGGGADTDIFVIRRATSRAEILDFERGLDRVDVRDLPMLRDLSQLVVTPTATGAWITYRGVEIIVTAADGRPLTSADLFPGGLLGADRLPIFLVTEPGQQITGTRHNDTLTGGTGNDTIRGGAGDDLIYGWRGNNRLTAGPGDDTIWGAPGDDTFKGGAGHDLIYAGGGRNHVSGDGGNDTIYGGSGNETLRGGAGHDLIFCGAGDDLIYGGTGNDTVHGGPGNDRLWGGAGDDALYGGDGDDLLIAGRGRDHLWGGAGADTFVFGRDQSTNRIFDFSIEDGDRLRLAWGIFRGHEAMPPEEMISRFGSINPSGNAVLDFTALGVDTIIIFVGFSDLSLITSAIEIA